MVRLFDFLAQTKTLWVTFTAAFILTLCFGLIIHIWEFGIIDEMYAPEKIIAHIENMTPLQRRVHAIMTGTIDVLYPFAYGGFFIGMAKRHFVKYGTWLALPSLLVIPADLAEGITQIFLLNGHYDFAGLKAIFTPLKLGLYGIGVIVTLAAICIAICSYISKKKQQH